MKILICGMPRSMTTWAFNVVRELVSNKSVKTLWIDPNSKTEIEFSEKHTDVLGKCHHYSEYLADSSELVVYSYRDIRTAAVSYKRKFHSVCSRGQLEAWLANGSAWLPKAHVILRYEDVEQHPAKAVKQLRDAIITRFGCGKIEDISDSDVLNRVNIAFENRQTPAEITYDSNTMITPEHRTFQPPPNELTGDDLILFNRVDSEFATWLEDFSYLRKSTNDKKLEHQIALKLLQSINEPVVVDVGAGIGIFTQLACEAGSAKVIGFEPFPRHLNNLIKKFEAFEQVDIYSLAISNKSGLADLHIAIDKNGRELDFYHSLSNMTDSATVVRSSKSLRVETASILELVTQEKLPSHISLLKIETDGHELLILEGLGLLRPSIISVEFWDNLPDTRGNNTHTLNSLCIWARNHDYTKMIVVRHNAQLEQIDINSTWSLLEDWGTVFFLHNKFDFECVRIAVEECIKLTYKNQCKHVAALVKEIECKEAEIQHLAAALRQYDNVSLPENSIFSKNSVDYSTFLLNINTMYQNDILKKDKQIESMTLELMESNRELMEKEEVIRALSKAMLAYRLAYIATKPLNFLLSPIYFLTRFSIQKVGVLLSPLHIISRHGKAMLRPRLGNLNQYPPQPLPRFVNESNHRVLKNSLKISIVTPSYKQGHFIERTLNSVFDQNYANLEYFVQDGNSRDETINILKKYTEKLSGWVSEDDDGQSQAINRGFLKTNGDIMAWLNSDDLLLPGALSIVVNYFESHPEVDVVYGNRLLIDENDLEIGRWILPGHDSAVLSWVDYVPQETLFWRRRIWERVGSQIDESFRFAMDWDLLVRFRDAGAKFAHIPEFIGAFRIHEHQKTSANINEIGQQEMDRIRLRLLGALPTYKQIRRAAMPYMVKHIIFDFRYRLKEKLNLI